MLVLALSSLAATEKKVPSLAFLEYLAELEKVEDGYVGPLDMLDTKELTDSQLKSTKNDIKPIVSEQSEKATKPSSTKPMQDIKEGNHDD